MDPSDWSIVPALAALAAMGAVLVAAGVRFTRVVNELADRTGIGEALAGAVLLGATTSIPGLVTTATVALDGQASFAVSNSIGGIAVQTTFLAVADLTYRRTNLEHASASVPNLLTCLVVIGMLGVVLAATRGPSVTLLSVHPVTVLLVVMYLYGLLLGRRSRRDPQWQPKRTPQTVPDGGGGADAVRGTTARLWAEFAALAVVVGGAGWVVARAGLAVTEETGVSGAFVGAVVTAVVTSLPELVTTLTAVRIGAVTLAVGEIIGGNAFDVLFVAVADLAYRGGSVYHAVDDRTVFLLGGTIVLTAVLGAGMILRERRGIGFEGVSILVVYALVVGSLATMD